MLSCVDLTPSSLVIDIFGALSFRIRIQIRYTVTILKSGITLENYILPVVHIQSNMRMSTKIHHIILYPKISIIGKGVNVRYFD